MKHLPITFILAVSLTACAGRGERGRERPEPSPERKAEMVERFTARWDHDRDGTVSCADVAFQRTRLFAQLDTDTDEQLSSGEYRYAKFEDKGFLFHLFADVDTDLSDSVSLSEFQAVTNSRFASADKDGDCIISPEEAVNAMRVEVRDRRSGEDGARGERDGRSRGRGGQRPPNLTDGI